MEKYSAYRDPGTGIQPFLTPVPPAETNLLATITIPVRYLLATFRTLLVSLLVFAYLLARSVCLVSYPISPLYRSAEHVLIYIFGRAVLFVVGAIWISPEPFARKRVRGVKAVEKWTPKAGDIIISNWISWLEILWLAIYFNPTFVIPIPECIPEISQSPSITLTPRRRTGTGSVNVRVPSLPSAALMARVPIRGFKQVSLLELISLTGFVPPFGHSSEVALPLEEIRTKSAGPLVIFPECTTSNGRGLLRFASVFKHNVPLKSYQVFVMAIRYDPPKAVSPAVSHSLPSRYLNPITHVFLVATSLLPIQMTIRLLAPSESPGSQLFMTHEILSDYTGDDPLSETCAILISQMGKLKRTGLGWEDKANFLEFYKSKEHD